MSSPPPVLQYALPDSKSDRRLAALKKRNKYLLRVRLGLLALVVVIFAYGLQYPSRSFEREKIASILVLASLAYSLIGSIAASATVIGGVFIVIAGLLMSAFFTYTIVSFSQLASDGSTCGISLTLLLAATWKLLHLATWPTPGIDDTKPAPFTPPHPFVQPDTSEDPHLNPPSKVGP